MGESSYAYVRARPDPMDNPTPCITRDQEKSTTADAQGKLTVRLDTLS